MLIKSLRVSLLQAVSAEIVREVDIPLRGFTGTVGDSVVSLSVLASVCLSFVVGLSSVSAESGLKCPVTQLTHSRCLHEAPCHATTGLLVRVHGSAKMCVKCELHTRHT